MAFVTVPHRPEIGRRMEPADRREQILSVSAALFEQKSYSEVSVTEIAEAAGVARPLINHYFGSKRALFLEIVRRMSELRPQGFAQIPISDPEAAAAAIVDHWLRVLKRHPRMWLLSITLQGSGADAEVAEIFTSGNLAVADQVLVALGLADGSDQPRRRAAILAFGHLAIEASRQWLVEGTLTEDDVRTLATTTLAGIADSLRG